ncbi:MAG: acetylxylan esterase [Bacteroidales bacterium]|nr:acetylxylan esterase [Bacteroidales bacterium]
MKKIQLILCCLSLSLALWSQSTQGLRFRQPLAYHQYLMRDLHRQTQARNEALDEASRSKAAMQQYIRDARQRLEQIVGELPDRGDLQAQVTGRYEGPGFVVEKIVFQSAPGRYVTAHLFLPANVKGKVPACIEMCGHGLTGKGNGSGMAIRMAVNGIAVMVVDPISQGERLQLIDSQGQALTRGVTTEHTLVNPAFVLLGSSLAAQEYFDNSRAIDYLLTRREIDAQKIGAYGFSGGGTQAAYLIALDDRVQCGCVGLFFSSRERTLELIGPSDGCQQIPYESAMGIEIADMAIMAAPKPFIVLDGEYDFVDHWGALQSFKDLEKCYQALGHPERIRQYYAQDGHAAPADVQNELYAWFGHWLKGSDEAFRPAPFWRGEDMHCTKSGQVNLEYPDAQSTMAMTLAEMERYAPRRAAFVRQDPASVKKVLCHYLAIDEELPEIEIIPTGRSQGRDYTDYRFQLNRPGEMPLPCVVRIPDNATPESSIRIQLCEQGKAWYLGEMERRDFVSNGTVIIAADFRGIGETADPYELNLLKYWNKDYRLSASALHIGRPLLGQRVVDMITLLDLCSSHEQLKGRRIEVAADGVYGPVVCHAAVLDQRIARATLTRTLRSWRSYLENPMQHDMLANVLFGALKDYDLPDLVRLSQGRINYGD